MFSRQDIAAALKRLAGTERVVVYDVHEEDAPERASAASPFIRGSAAWWDFVRRRRELDDGQNLTLLVSMRGLRAEERLLIVNWGSAYANTFLLIEPSDPWLDLTTNESTSKLAAQTANETDPDKFVRAAYADWVYWFTTPEGQTDSHMATLDLADPASTLWAAMWQKLPQTFPESDYLSSLTLLTLREAELFTGGREVARAIVPFLTRLGLPILYDARFVIGGVRQLVNAGLAWVQDPEDNWRLYKGPVEPIPAEVTDERLSMMVR
jgi:hypothetical protein